MCPVFYVQYSSIVKLYFTFLSAGPMRGWYRGNIVPGPGLRGPGKIIYFAQMFRENNKYTSLQIASS